MEEWEKDVPDMKLSEFIAVLHKRLRTHGDLPVRITWEGTIHNVASRYVYLAKEGAVFIDADENAYKDSFAVDPTEDEL